MAACTVIAKRTAAARPHFHSVPDNARTRNESARTAFHERGGPPPPAHHMYAIRNTASTAAAIGMPSLNSSSGQTFAAAIPTTMPTTIARGMTGMRAHNPPPFETSLISDQPLRMSTCSLSLSVQLSIVERIVKVFVESLRRTCGFLGVMHSTRGPTFSAHRPTPCVPKLVVVVSTTLVVERRAAP